MNDKEVALLAEGVDRNHDALTNGYSQPLSPSSRRAWIEITGNTKHRHRDTRRPPRGGRG